MIKVFVTGSEGFVGQTFIKQAGNKLSIFGLTLNGNLKPSENVRYLEGNILNRQLLKEFFKQYKPDVILHLAAISTTKGNDASDVFEVNVTGTLNLYLAILDVQETMKFSPNIIFVSSATVYGKTKGSDPIDETTLLNPTNTYASSKVAGDRLSYQLSQSNKLNTLILRPFNHTGPGQRTGFFIPDVISQIAQAEVGKQGTDIFVGNVDVTRDYSDVRDVVEVYKYFVENNFTPGDTFNISSGKGVKLSEILKILKGLAKKPINFKVEPARFRADDSPVIIGSNKKLTKRSGWTPKIPLEQTLQDTLDYYRQLWKDSKD